MRLLKLLSFLKMNSRIAIVTGILVSFAGGAIGGKLPELGWSEAVWIAAQPQSQWRELWDQRKANEANAR